MKLEALPWLILFLPLLAAGIITLFTLRNKAVSAALSIGAIVTGFVLTLIFIKVNGFAGSETALNWLSIGNLNVDFGLKLDALSLMMLLIVTGVGSAIHIYSYGYMHEDPAFSRFFACLSLFTFSMLGIVLSNNFLQMFIFWELVGVSSYLLIGFWFEKASAADACKKAFLTNRIGDFGFMLGILMIFTVAGSLNFSSIKDQLVANPTLLGGTATLAGLLIFCGGMGKSAQFPLHVWLPDAMEGPTPVSALIHAATMVTAGVYLIVRSGPVFNLAPTAQTAVVIVGAVTLLFGAIIGCAKDDIKKALAASTMSQIGYMVLAAGLGPAGYAVAIMHLLTHGFFKAGLFLGAGSVMHATNDETDMRRFGGLRKLLPVTFITFGLGYLAIIGVPPFAGFFSKDAIIETAVNAGGLKGVVLGGATLLGAAIT